MKFGNISIEEFEKRNNVNFSNEDRKWLVEHRTRIANGEKGKFHIFEYPFCIEYSKDIEKDLMNILSKYNLV